MGRWGPVLAGGLWPANSLNNTDEEQDRNVCSENHVDAIRALISLRTSTERIPVLWEHSRAVATLHTPACAHRTAVCARCQVQFAVPARWREGKLVQLLAY